MSDTPIIPNKAELPDAAFKKLDAGGNGYVSKEDIRGMSGFEKSFQLADANKDGKLDARGVQESLGGLHGTRERLTSFSFAPRMRRRPLAFGAPLMSTRARRLRATASPGPAGAPRGGPIHATDAALCATARAPCRRCRPVSRHDPSAPRHTRRHDAPDELAAETQRRRSAAALKPLAGVDDQMQHFL